MTTSLESGAQFVSDADVEAALDEAGIPPRSTRARARSTASARLDALRNGMVALALFCIVALFIVAACAGLPERPSVTGAPARALSYCS